MNTYDELEKTLRNELDLDRMKRDAEVFSKLERYSGSPQGEAAVDYICRQLDEAGVPNERLRYPLLRSLPLTASVSVKKPEALCMEATATVYSGEAHGLKGELLWDEWCMQDTLTGLESEKRYQGMKGKIILTYDISFSFYY